MTRPSPTRHGKTTTVKVGYASLQLTLNKWEGGAEVFCKYAFDRAGAKDIIERVQKSDPAACQLVMDALVAPQGYLDRICTMASIAMQGRGDAETVARHLIGDKTWPRGVPGQPLSCVDAIGKAVNAKAEGLR